jgi:tRNA G18 (ribose-2'-O)-methylase SpoU
MWHGLMMNGPQLSLCSSSPPPFRILLGRSSLDVFVRQIFQLSDLHQCSTSNLRWRTSRRESAQFCDSNGSITQFPFWLAVESVDLPGNLGTILRSADAAGASGVILVGDGADPHDPACVRATMGALFSLKMVRCTLREFGQWARTNDVAIVGSSPHGLVSYRRFCCRWPAGLVVGSERDGLSEELLEICNFVLRIPMRGKSNSINAAVAAGVLLFEFAGQKSG